MSVLPVFVTFYFPNWRSRNWSALREASLAIFRYVALKLEFKDDECCWKAYVKV